MAKIIDRVYSGTDEFLFQDHRLPDGDIQIGGVTPGYGLTTLNNCIAINNYNCSSNSSNYSLAIGSGTLASGEGSFAEGCNTKTIGIASHAEGYNTIASGNYSHAECYSVLASGHYSHAEGKYTSAIGECSHAEGYYTSANGYYSHAEGGFTITHGSFSHAEGYGTSSNGTYSHAGGYNTIANYSAQTVIGAYNDSAVESLFSVGNGNGDANRLNAFDVYKTGVASAQIDVKANSASLTSVYDTVNTNSAEWSQGGVSEYSAGDNINITNNVISGKSWSAEINEKLDTSAFSDVSGTFLTAHQDISNKLDTSSFSDVSGSFLTAHQSITASGNWDSTYSTVSSHSADWEQGGGVELTAISPLKIENNVISNNGNSVVVSGLNAWAEGANTTAIGECSHAEGSSTSANGTCSHAEGRNTLASGNYSHAEGHSTSANGICSHAEGYKTLASGNYSHAEGSNTIASGQYSHAEGRNTIARVNYSHAEGSSTSANGTCSHAEGTNTIASGNYSHAEGRITSAIGECSHAEGFYTSAKGACSHAEGFYTSAKFNYSHAGGYYTITTNDYETVIGKYNNSSRTDTPLFVVGNGTDNNRSDAFVVFENGTVSAKTILAENYPGPNITGDGLIETEETSTNLIIKCSTDFYNLATGLSATFITNKPSDSNDYVLHYKNGQFVWEAV